MAPRPPTKVPSVSHSISILRLLGKSGESMGVTAIARALDLSPSSTFNLARTLVAEGLVDFDEATKTYRIGLGSIDFARMALRGDTMVAALRPVMERLAERHDAAIGLWRAADSGRLLLLALAESEAATRIHMAVGQRQPVGAGSTGRALLAARAADATTLRAAHAGVRWPSALDADSYVSQVHEAARLGYAVDDQWLNPGIVTVAAVVPEPGAPPRYCLSASLFAGRHDASGVAAIGRDIMAEARTAGQERE
ncbi:helix-turn-helix domain-containing protein [Sphingomonas lacunae]|uniref:Helix-turn-helix domain-containing protein n=1 Tax=Sphingomonas lacunae TaxID=2698828 RepID=A0A6M4AX30_9SPHN|nr:helix-turn-helix domain-containing protein [Sphingomonas lacunae]QJQ31511.1 helix-turn-helix domain-containing protein [Sphingomonas lacunae]